MTDITVLSAAVSRFRLIRPESEAGERFLSAKLNVTVLVAHPAHTVLVRFAQKCAEQAVAEGLEVARLDRTLPEVPLPLQADHLVEAARVGARRGHGVHPTVEESVQTAPELLARSTKERHLRTLQELRGRLEGEEKTALRWALQKLTAIEARLAEIERIARRA